MPAVADREEKERWYVIFQAEVKGSDGQGGTVLATQAALSKKVAATGSNRISV